MLPVLIESGEVLVLISLGIIVYDGMKTWWLYSLHRRYFQYDQDTQTFGLPPTDAEKSARAEQSEKLNASGVLALSLGAIGIVVGILL